MEDILLEQSRDILHGEGEGIFPSCRPLAAYSEKILPQGYKSHIFHKLKFNFWKLLACEAVRDGCLQIIQ